MHTYKFSRDIIFADDHFLSTLTLRCIVTVVTALKNFEDLIFVDDKLPMKAAKMMSLENLYVCGSVFDKVLWCTKWR